MSEVHNFDGPTLVPDIGGQKPRRLERLLLQLSLQNQRTIVKRAFIEFGDESKADLLVEPHSNAVILVDVASIKTRA